MFIECREGLKIRRRQLHGGSTPPPGTTAPSFENHFIRITYVHLIALQKGTRVRFRVKKWVQCVSYLH